MSDIEALRTACHSGDPDAQLPALLELIKLHDEDSLPAITPLLASPDEQVRAEAARAVGYLGSSQAQSLGPLLLPLLNDSNELARDEAVEALGLVIYPPAIPQLITILHNDDSWLVRASAAEALGNYQDAALIPELEKVLHNAQEEAEVQVYVARSLGQLADATYLPTLDTLIAQQSWEPQVHAALLAAGYRLGGGSLYLEPLLNLVQHADEEESWSLLNEIQAVVENSPPALLRADGSRIRTALQDVATRWPLTAQQSREIEGQLPQP
ncbi:HEAT repeat domain-containing protein [Tengunoibacter tsumagoiensis]|uniref:HEAT repeat domain-containing protein n=1 Tax=Tengunoibacter tsumagoiensis TaxID=2014871 RepID=A0A402A629_9CHLR|nr:HEAT repeat domain-containing protein [Tengunoibacter tsumagoiensis]GCE14582.1 hypothetical protein KTT_44410 [Tengunoibacter tsumagoiensis]